MNILSISKFRATIAVLALALTAAIAAPAAHAQNPEHTVKVNVPFAFVVNDAQLPAGQYTISELSSRLMKLEGASTSVLFIAQTGENSDASGQGKVVFHRYGDRYFLHAIARPGAGSTRECLQSKAENQARKTMMAANPTKNADWQIAFVEPQQ